MGRTGLGEPAGGRLSENAKPARDEVGAARGEARGRGRGRRANEPRDEEALAADGDLGLVVVGERLREGDRRKRLGAEVDKA
jgi:hypothetical protein